ncbi:MAG TPA: class IV adenylate cyclase [Vicinamibacterales bacterium]|nr:class IV adenylate cyclase [Vicinamibacterales bacterium]
MALEREIKLRFDSADDARARVTALGATPLRGRRLQEDALLDTTDDALGHRRSALRIRSEPGKSLLTYKGPPQAGPMKLREELETPVGDGTVLLAILEALGLRIRFRYEKYREEFVSGDLVIAIDETPVGVFVELEGSETHIHDTARLLGFSPADYITDSYRTLFLAYRDPQGSADMVFADPSDS